MTVKQFAQIHRLKTRLDEDGTDIIPGKVGHIYEYDRTTLGVMVMPKPARGAKWWGNRGRKLQALGFEIQQDGDTEGSATFDPDNSAQVVGALRVAGIKRRRVMSPKQVETARKALEIARQRRVK